MNVSYNCKMAKFYFVSILFFFEFKIKSVIIDYMTYPLTLIRDHIAGSHTLEKQDLAKIEKRLTSGRYQFLAFTQTGCACIILATIVCAVAKSVFAASFLPFSLVALAILVVLERPEKITKNLKQLVKTLDLAVEINEKKSETSNKRAGVHTIDEFDSDTLHVKIDIAGLDLNKCVQESVNTHFSQIEKMYLGLTKIEKWVLGSLHEGKEYIPLSQIKESKDRNLGPGHVLGGI